MEDAVKRGLEASGKLKLEMAKDGSSSVVASMAGMCVEAIRAGGKIILAGNGGSAADAQHIAAELVGRYKKDRAPIAAVALTTDTSALTAISNDYGYDAVFSRQLQALARPGDVFWAISTSGQSANLIEALKKANALGLKCVCLLGKGGGEMKALADAALVVPSDDTPRIQEAHITVAHIICELVESAVAEER